MQDFEQAWAVYERHLRRRRRRSSSIVQYRIRLGTWISWLNGEGLAWQDAGPDELEAFCHRPCRPRSVHAGQPLAQATRSTYGGSIPGFYHALYALGLLERDRFAGYLAPPAPDPSPEPLPQSACRRLLEYVHAHPDRRLEPLVGLGLWAGLRMGETTTMTVGSVRLRTVPPRLLVLGKARLEPVALPIHTALRPILERYAYWLAGQAGLSSPYQLPAGTPLFSSRTRPGEPVGRSWPSRLVARAMHDADVEGRPHDLRRTYGHWIGERTGDNLEALRCGLRHRGYSALRHYRQPPLERVAGWVEQVPDPRLSDLSAGE